MKYLISYLKPALKALIFRESVCIKTGQKTLIYLTALLRNYTCETTTLLITTTEHSQTGFPSVKREREFQCVVIKKDFLG